MTGFENIAVGGSSIPSLVITVVLMAAMPVVFFLCWRRRRKPRISAGYLIAGAVGFIVSSRVLETVVHYFCIIADNPVSRFINGSTVAYVLYGITMAGVFEEAGRFIILKFILKNKRTRENAVLYGIGHGGAEVLALALPTMVVYLIIAIALSSGNTENALSLLNVTEENAYAALPVIQSAASFDFAAAAVNVIERLLAMTVHIGLSVIVFYGVKNANKLALPAAIVLHMLADTFAALYQRGAMPLWAAEVWLAAWAAVIVFVALRLYKKMDAVPQEDSGQEAES